MIKMRLQDKWDAELKKIESKISKVNSTIDQIDQEMNEKIEEVKKPYMKKMRYQGKKIGNLESQLDLAKENIRKKYAIIHPEQRKFRKSRDAARVLAHYWQGDEISEPDLILKIISNVDTYVEAVEYVDLLTSENSPERKYANKAGRFLWRNDRSSGR